jgi:hypothetical protein
MTNKFAPIQNTVVLKLWSHTQKHKKQFAQQSLLFEIKIKSTQGNTWRA